MTNTTHSRVWLVFIPLDWTVLSSRNLESGFEIEVAWTLMFILQVHKRTSFSLFLSLSLCLSLSFSLRSLPETSFLWVLLSELLCCQSICLSLIWHLLLHDYFISCWRDMHLSLIFKQRERSQRQGPFKFSCQLKMFATCQSLDSMRWTKSDGLSSF